MGSGSLQNGRVGQVKFYPYEKREEGRQHFGHAEGDVQKVSDQRFSHFPEKFVSKRLKLIFKNWYAPCILQ